MSISHVLLSGVDSARNALPRHPGRAHGQGRTIRINVAGFRTTEFNLSNAKRDELLGRGRQAAQAFFDDFEPEGYRNAGGHELTERAKAGLA